jgi:hypothetical protein
MALVPGPADGASLHPRSPVNSNRAPAAARATPVQAARIARAEPGLPPGNWSAMTCAARRAGGGPQPVTGRLLATGDGTGAALVEGVGLGVVLVPTLAELEELALALAELDALPLPKLAAGSAQGDPVVLGVAVAEVVGVAVAEVVGVAVAEVVGVAVAVVVGVVVGVAGGEHRNGNPAASDGLLRIDCSSLGMGKGFVIAVGTTKLGNGPGVVVGEPDEVGVAAPAGQVSASSRFWTCAWLSSVITVAEACVSCAPGKVAT